MTATPRIYGDGAKASAERGNVTLCSMDDRCFTVLSCCHQFSEAVRLGLLCDYKVIVLSIEESHVSRASRAAQGREQRAARGRCGQDRRLLEGAGQARPARRAGRRRRPDEARRRLLPGHRAQTRRKDHKVSSKNIAGMFQAVVEAYQASWMTASERAYADVRGTTRGWQHERQREGGAS
jgi:predicted helicase